MATKNTRFASEVKDNVYDQNLSEQFLNPSMDDKDESFVDMDRFPPKRMATGGFIYSFFTCKCMCKLTRLISTRWNHRGDDSEEFPEKVERMRTAPMGTLISLTTGSTLRGTIFNLINTVIGKAVEYLRIETITFKTLWLQSN